MSYTPTTQQVEDGFAHEPEYEFHDPINYGSHVQSNRRAFKRWLAALIREAKAEARGEALINAVQAHRKLHETYGSTSVCHGGIGGQAMTPHCAEICDNTNAHLTEISAWVALELEAVEFSRARAAEHLTGGTK